MNKIFPFLLTLGIFLIILYNQNDLLGVTSESTETPKSKDVAWVQKKLNIPDDSGGRRRVSSDTLDSLRELNSSYGNDPYHRTDSTYKPIGMWVGNLDTAGIAPWEHINPDMMDTLNKNGYWLMLDSHFVFKDWGCFKWYGKLGITPKVPDTLWLVDTCKTGCLKAFTVPLGCWDSTEITFPTDSVFKCDTVCKIIEYKDSIGWILCDEEVSDLLILQDSITGSPYDTCGIGQYCFIWNDDSCTFIDIIQHGRQASNLENTVPCPTIVGPGDSVICISKAVFQVYETRRRAAGVPIRYIAIPGYSDTTTVDCDDYRLYPDVYNITPQKLFYRYVENCRWSTGTSTTKVPTWVPAGRDTTVYIDTCETKCPKVIVSCQNGYWDSTQAIVPTSEYIPVLDTTYCNTIGQYFTIIDSVQTYYRPASSVVSINRAQFDSIATVLGTGTIICDTLSPWVYNSQNLPPWIPGYTPIRIGHYPIIWDDPTAPTNRIGTGVFQAVANPSIPCSMTPLQWVGIMQKALIHNASSPYEVYSNFVSRYCWIPQATVDSLCARYYVEERCGITQRYERVRWYNACGKDTTIYFQCKRPDGSVVQTDSITYQKPDLLATIKVDTTWVNSPSGFDTVWVKTWVPNFSYVISYYDTCSCADPQLTLVNGTKRLCDIKFVNLCPDGMQPYWLDENTVAFNYSCATTINGQSGTDFNLPTYEYVDYLGNILNKDITQAELYIDTLLADKWNTYESGGYTVGVPTWSDSSVFKITNGGSLSAVSFNEISANAGFNFNFDASTLYGMTRFGQGMQQNLIISTGAGFVILGNNETASGTNIYNGGGLSLVAAATEKRPIRLYSVETHNDTDTVLTWTEASHLGVMKKDPKHTVDVNGVGRFDSTVILNGSTDVGKYLDSLIKANDYVQGSGRIYGGKITTNTDGTINVAGGLGWIKSVDTDFEDLPLDDCGSCPDDSSSAAISHNQTISWDSTANIVLVDSAYNYIYFSGTDSTIKATTDFYSISLYRDFTLGRAYRMGTMVIARLCGTNVWNFDRRVQLFGEEYFPVVRAKGMNVGAGAFRSLTVTSGVMWAELVNRFPTPARNTATDSLTRWWRSGTGWQSERHARIDSMRYDNGSGTRATLTPGRYGVHWVYVVHDGSVHTVYGRGDYTLAQAQTATVQTLPGLLSAYATLRAKIIIQRGAGTFTSLESPDTQIFSVTPISDHNSLSGLQGGATSDYYHLTKAQLDDISVDSTKISAGANISLVGNAITGYTISATTGSGGTGLQALQGLNKKSIILKDTVGPLQFTAVPYDSTIQISIHPDSVLKYQRDTSAQGFWNLRNYWPLAIDTSKSQGIIGFDTTKFQGLPEADPVWTIQKTSYFAKTDSVIIATNRLPKSDSNGIITNYITLSKLRVELKDSLQHYARLNNLPDLSVYRLKSDTSKPTGTVTWSLIRIEMKDSLQYYARISNLPDLTGYRLKSDTTKPAGNPTWTQLRIEVKDSLQHYARIVNLPNLSDYRLKSDTTKPAGTATWTQLRIELKDSLQHYARISNLPNLGDYRLKSDTTKPTGTVTWTLLRQELSDSVATIDTTHFIRNLESGMSHTIGQTIPNRLTLSRGAILEGLSASTYDDTLLTVTNTGIIQKLPFTIPDSVYEVRLRTKALEDSVTRLRYVIDSLRNTTATDLITLTAGENLSAGDICYLAGDGSAMKASNTGAITAKGLLVIATTSISVTNSGVFRLSGNYTTSGLTVGDVIYLGASGAMTSAEPNSSGEVIRILGYALSSTLLRFTPDESYVVVP